MVWIMVSNATFNHISALSRRSVLLVEKTTVPGENHRPVQLPYNYDHDGPTSKYKEVYDHPYIHISNVVA